MSLESNHDALINNLILMLLFISHRAPPTPLCGLWIEVLVVWFRQFIDLVRIPLLNNLIFTSDFERGPEVSDCLVNRGSLEPFLGPGRPGRLPGRMELKWHPKGKPNETQMEPK